MLAFFENERILIKGVNGSDDPAVIRMSQARIT